MMIDSVIVRPVKSVMLGRSSACIWDSIWILGRIANLSGDYGKRECSDG